jgi:hypothetical protein
MPGRLAVGTTFDFADQINLVSPSIGGETPPQSTAKVYAESGLIITVVEGTGAEGLIATPFEMEIEPAERKDSPDPDLRFEMPERVSGIMHFCSSLGCRELCVVAVLAGRRSR